MFLCAGEMFTGTSRKPYVRDPSVQTGPQYGGVGSTYSGGFNTGPVPNNPAVPSYPSKPTNTMYPAADVYNPAENVNTQPTGVSPGISPVNAPPGWNDPPILKNSSRTQVCSITICLYAVLLLFLENLHCINFCFSHSTHSGCSFTVPADGDNQPLKCIYFLSTHWTISRKEISVVVSLSCLEIYL
jgi:hypothetical protein